MKLPQSFIPEKDYDKKVKEALQPKKKIKDVLTLIGPQNRFKGYRMYKEPSLIIEDMWDGHFLSDVIEDLIEAGKVNHSKITTKVTNRFFTTIYALKFGSKKNLDSLIREHNLINGINNEDVALRFLKKDEYLIQIELNQQVIQDMEIFKGWYINHWEMEEL